MKAKKRKAHIKKLRNGPRVKPVAATPSGYEYIVEDFENAGTSDIEVRLNSLGEEGWYLTAIDKGRHYFVRESGPKPKE